MWFAICPRLENTVTFTLAKAKTEVLCHSFCKTEVSVENSIDTTTLV